MMNNNNSGVIEIGLTKPAAIFTLLKIDVYSIENWIVVPKYFDI